MNCHHLLSGFLLAATLAGCSSGSGSSSSPSATLTANVTNVGFHTLNVRSAGDTVAFLAEEAGQGFVDLNGDGDALDRVVVLVDSATGATTNLELATLDFRLNENTVALLVDEADQGGVDLNGNLNPNDIVMHVVDIATGSVTNLGLASNGLFEFDGGVLVFTVPEVTEGFDLNGDGDSVDDVLFAHDTATGIDWNLELATETSFFVDGGFLLAVVSEQRQGQTDLNGDGDFDDHVAHLVDLGSFVPANLALAVDFSVQSAQGLNLNLGDGIVAVTVHEEDQGGTDLDGDGDADDPVAFIIDIASRTVWNTGMPAYDFDYSFGAGKVAFTGAEVGSYGLRVFDTGTGILFDIGIEALVRGTARNKVILGVSESANGLDLNGDGDQMDDVVGLFDLTTLTFANTGLAGFDAVAVDGSGFMIVVREAEQGGKDLNRDGDAVDKVLFRYDTTTGRSKLLDAEGDPVATVDGVALGYVTFEDQDLNGDGDALDVVLQFVPAAGGPELNTGLAGFAFPTPRPQAFTGTVPFLVDEGAQGGVDLNGDGDDADLVLHLVTPMLE
jgi:hypothetical protein